MYTYLTSIFEKEPSLGRSEIIGDPIQLLINRIDTTVRTYSDQAIFAITNYVFIITCR